jgi:hypothetical protein
MNGLKLNINMNHSDILHQKSNFLNFFLINILLVQLIIYLIKITLI